MTSPKLFIEIAAMVLLLPLVLVVFRYLMALMFSFFMLLIAFILKLRQKSKERALEKFRLAVTEKASNREIKRIIKNMIQAEQEGNGTHQLSIDTLNLFGATESFRSRYEEARERNAKWQKSPIRYAVILVMASPVLVSVLYLIWDWIARELK